MKGYEVSAWREFLRKHDDIETYNRIKCENCHNEYPYCYCSHPRFQKMTEGET